MQNYLKKYDVVIIGGGTSGCAAAFNCAKLKLKTLLVEKRNYLGGLMTGGLVVPVMKSSVDDLNTDFYKNLVIKAKTYNSQITYSDGNDGWFNPEVLKIVLCDILSSNNLQKYLDILFETSISKVLVTSKTVSGVELKSGSLSIPIEAKYYIDATGSGVLCRLANCKFLDDNTESQQNSLRFIVGNVNISKLVKFLMKVDNDKNITNTYQDDINTNNEMHFTSASTSDNSRKWNLDKILTEAVKDKVLKEYDRSYFQIFSVAGGVGQVAFNCPRLKNYKNSAFQSSKELISGYKAIYRLYTFAKKYLAGFENSTIINIADITGIREEYRLKTKYIYKVDDMINEKHFKNPVLRANYEIDVHSDKKNKKTFKKCNYELPIESLMSVDVDNLFVAGKLVGAEFKAHSALRVQKSCMSMGEAVAKYIASHIV